MPAALCPFIYARLYIVVCPKDGPTALNEWIQMADWPDSRRNAAEAACTGVRAFSRNL
jgi:hypothetical protein